MTNPSKALLKVLHARLSLLAGVLYGLRSHITSYTDAIYDLVTAVSKVPDATIITASTHVLSIIPSLLGSDRPDLRALYSRRHDLPLTLPGSVNNAVARWVARDMDGSPPIPWHCVTPEETAVARALLERGMRDMRAELDAMIADGSISESGHAARLRLRRVQSVLYAIQTSAPIGLHDVQVDPDAAGLTGKADGDVDSINTPIVPPPGWDGNTLTHDVMRASLDIIEHVDAGNTWSLSMAISSLEVCIATALAGA